AVVRVVGDYEGGRTPGDALPHALWHNSVSISSTRAGIGCMASTGHMSDMTGDERVLVMGVPARAASATASTARRLCASEPGRIRHDRTFIDSAAPFARWNARRPSCC